MSESNSNSNSSGNITITAERKSETPNDAAIVNEDTNTVLNEQPSSGMYIYVYICLYVYACMYICICVYVCMDVYIYIC